MITKYKRKEEKFWSATEKQENFRWQGIQTAWKHCVPRKVEERWRMFSPYTSGES